MTSEAQRGRRFCQRQHSWEAVGNLEGRAQKIPASEAVTSSSVQLLGPGPPVLLVVSLCFHFISVSLTLKSSRFCPLLKASQHNHGDMGSSTCPADSASTRIFWGASLALLHEETRLRMGHCSLLHGVSKKHIYHVGVQECSFVTGRGPVMYRHWLE